MAAGGIFLGYLLPAYTLAGFHTTESLFTEIGTTCLVQNRMIIQYFGLFGVLIKFIFSRRLHDVLSLRRSDHDPGSDESVLIKARGHYGQRNCLDVGRPRLRIYRPAADDECVDFVAPFRFASALDAPCAAEAGLWQCHPVV